MVIIWISVLLAIKAVNSCVYYECSARKLFHSSGHGSPNLTEFWICLFKYHTAFVIMWIYTLYAEKWSMYLRKKQRHTCNRQSSARTWTDLLQAHRLRFHSVWEGEVEKQNSIKLNLTLFKGIWNFWIFFLWYAFFLIYVSARKRALNCWETVPDFCVNFFFSLSFSRERGECEKVLGFFLLLFWNSP